MDVPQFPQASLEGHLGCLQFEAIMNKAAINRCLHVCFFFFCAFIVFFSSAH